MYTHIKLIERESHLIGTHRLYVKLFTDHILSQIMKYNVDAD